MAREVFFDWLVASVLAHDTHGFRWQVTEDDGAGCITVKFHNVEEKEETNG